MAIIVSDDMDKLAGFDSSAYDPTDLALAVAAVCEMIEDYCGRHFDSAERTETLDGNGKDELYLAEYPITLVDSVTIDGTAITDYVALTQSLYREDLFTAGRRNIVVVYTAGYESADMPSLLKLTAMQMTSDLLSASSRDAALRGETFADGYAYQLAQSSGAPVELIQFYETTLSRYRTPVL
jgi:hypothetical protein